MHFRHAGHKHMNNKGKSGLEKSPPVVTRLEGEDKKA
jgi:hypothetical protein